MLLYYGEDELIRQPAPLGVFALASPLRFCNRPRGSSNRGMAPSIPNDSLLAPDESLSWTDHWRRDRCQLMPGSRDQGAARHIRSESRGASYARPSPSGVAPISTGLRLMPVPEHRQPLSRRLMSNSLRLFIGSSAQGKTSVRPGLHRPEPWMPHDGGRQPRSSATRSSQWPHVHPSGTCGAASRTEAAGRLALSLDPAAGSHNFLEPYGDSTGGAGGDREITCEGARRPISSRSKPPPANARATSSLRPLFSLISAA